MKRLIAAFLVVAGIGGVLSTSLAHTLSVDYLLRLAVWLVGGVVAFIGLLMLRRYVMRKPRTIGWKTGVTLVHLSLAGWMVLACLTLPELYFALFYDTTDSFNQTNVSKRWFELHAKPQQRVIEFPDGQGHDYRDDHQFPRRMPDDQHHIVFVGDSFTYGHGVNDVTHRFSNRLADSIRSDAPEIVVSNLAKAGIELHYVAELLAKLFKNNQRVDTAIYVVCLNDIETFSPEHMEFYGKLGNIQPPLQRGTALIGHARYYLSRWRRESYFYDWAYYRWKMLAHSEIGHYYEHVQEYYAGRPWMFMQRKINEVANLCREHNSQLRVVIFPFLHNIGDDYPFAAAHGNIVAFCNENNIPVVDLQQTFMGHNPRELTVNGFDAHPNEKAHALAAETIRRELLADLIDAASE